MKSADTVGTKREIQLKRAMDSAPRAALARAMKRDITDPSIEYILQECEVFLGQFMHSTSKQTGFFLNDSRISGDALTAALSTMNAFAKSLGALNAIELRAACQLVHRRLNPKNDPRGTTSKSVREALEICAQASLKKSQISKPATILRRGLAGTPSDPAYKPLAAAVLKIWCDQNIIVGRSKNTQGVLSLTRLLLACFDQESHVSILCKFDPAGNALGPEDRFVVEKVTMSEISKSLLGRLDTAMREGRGKTRSNPTPSWDTKIA